MEDRLVGSSLGQYRIVARVGQGGMGVVYKAHQPALDRYVAIKVLIAHLLGGPDFSARFRREARAVASLEHPNILPLYDYGEIDGAPFIVMPFMPGGTLRDRLVARMPFTWSARICAHLAEALDHAHEHDVIHRDVKPANVLMGEGEWPLLSDFGISKIVGASTALTEIGTGIGTPAYVSPEQSQGLDVDGRTDQYALAAMLFEMLGGRVPFEANTPIGVVLKHINESVPSIRPLNPDVPAAADEVLRRGLAKRPEDRFASCRDFARAFANVIEGAVDATVNAKYQPTIASPWRERGAPRVGVEYGRALPEEAAKHEAGGARDVDGPGVPVPVLPDPVARVRTAAVGPGIWAAARLRLLSAMRQRAVVLAAVAAAVAVAASLILPRTWEPGPMGGLFNIAVAPFSEIDERGNAKAWDQGAKVSESIVVRLRDEFSAIPELKGMVEVRGQNVQPVAGRSGPERQEAARRLADRLRAQLLIYGTLERDGNRTVFSPEFYITGLDDAEELLGPNHLGSPVALGGPSGSLSQVFLVGEASKARTEALSLFAIGLTYYAAGKTAAAVDFFERALRVEGWEERDGKEVLHLFLGTAYRVRGGEGSRERARAAYEAALRANPEYARAYLGLGHLDFEEFATSGHADTDALDRALARYQQAAAAKFKPASAYVDAKIHLSLGNAYVVKAQMGQPELFRIAESEFLQVVSEYEGGAQQVRRAAAFAYLGLGIVEERWRQDYVRAGRYYRRVLAVSDDDGLKRQAEAQLKVIQSAAR